MRRYLFLPSAEPGNGTGHLVRTFRTASELLPRHGVWIYVPRDLWRPEFDRLLQKFGLGRENLLTDEKELNRHEWDFSIWDRKITTREEFDSWNRFGLCLGIDEGGSLRESFSYLIDTFPIPPRFGTANIADTGFLPQPNRRRELSEICESILISFGGEDPAHLTEKTLQWLLETGKQKPERITVVLGPLFGERELPVGINVLKNPRNLAELLYRYDLVCTMFGLTAYEAAAAGTGVVLFNPSEYHRELSRQAGFPEVGVLEVESERFTRYLEDPGEVIAAVKALRPSESLSLSEFLGDLQPPVIRNCPFCGSMDRHCLFREEGRSFFECPRCGLVYQQNFRLGSGEYGEDYFFSEYRNQYGRTYLEDFDAIRRFSQARLDVLKALMPSREQRLLDVGCAYGPFLVEARRSGYRSEGLDVVPEAVEYVRRTFDIPAVLMSFEEYEPGDGDFDIITMWFVIEHFADLGGVIEKVHRLLKPGGVFAFSTPNLEGVTGRGGYEKFFRKSPEDHHTVWSPEKAKKILASAGFSIEKTVITGHHPERFRVFSMINGLSPRKKGESSLPVRRGLCYSILNWYSRFRKMGDTFEIYAKKTGDSNV